MDAPETAAAAAGRASSFSFGVLNPAAPPARVVETHIPQCAGTNYNELGTTNDDAIMGSHNPPTIRIAHTIHNSNLLDEPTTAVAAAAAATGIENSHHQEVEVTGHVHVPQLPPQIDNHNVNNNNAEEEEGQNPPKKRSKHNTAHIQRVVPKVHNTENDKLETNQVLLETCSRLDNAISELIEYAAILSSDWGKSSANDDDDDDDDDSQSPEERQKKVIQNIRSSIVPLLYIASRSVHDTALSFAPCGGTRSLHQRNESQRKKEVVEAAKSDESTESRSVALRMIDDFVKKSVVKVPEHIARLKDLPVGPEHRSSGQTSEGHATAANAANSEGDEETQTISILRPMNGKQYTKTETVFTAKLYRKGSRERALAVRAMKEQGFVPASAKTISRLLKDDEEGKPITNELWGQIGRPKHMDDPEIVYAKRQVAKHLAEKGGRFTREDLMEVTLVVPKERRGRKRKGLEMLPSPMHLNPKVASRTLKSGSAAAAAASMPSPGKKKKKASSTKNNKPPKQQKQQQHSSAKSPQHTMATRSKQSAPPPTTTKQKEKSSGPSLQVLQFPLPPPRDGGKLYKKSECVEIAKRYQRGSPERRWAIEAMVHRGYVPNSVKSVYRLLQKDEKGELIIDTEWVSQGSPPLLSNSEIDALIERLKQEGGRIYGKADVEQLLVNAAREKVRRAGGNPDEAKIRFSATSVRNYATIFKSKMSGSFWKEL